MTISLTLFIVIVRKTWLKAHWGRNILPPMNYYPPIIHTTFLGLFFVQILRLTNTDYKIINLGRCELYVVPICDGGSDGLNTRTN